MLKKKIENLEELKLAKSNFYKEGSEFSKLQKRLKTASHSEKKQLGISLANLKKEAETFFEDCAKAIKEKEINNKIKSEWIDISSPIQSNGSLSLLTKVSDRFRTWLNSNGYYEVNGSEVETDEFNFEKLNIPKDHPARDMQDSLYINSKTLLRTHNTGFTARELSKNKNKEFSQFSIGKVYRNDDDDQTHSHQFMQVDLVAIGDYSFPNLIWTLKEMMSYVLEADVEIRMRPSFFPFTEPSVEVDVFYKDKWIEVLGAGMINDAVLKAAGYTNEMNGFAAGVGIERIAMIKYGINDIREFYTNDMRFLKQFKEVS